VVVDDLAQGVNLVIRGEDILPSTGRQILLHQLLSPTKPPHYVHHPLLTGPDGRKLSKRDFSAPIRDMLQDGVKPETLLGKAAFLCGLQASEKAISAHQLPELFGG
jgi:glutamyl/glutaminyl-tRNA synthetase